MIKTLWEKIDKQDIENSVMLLDLFTKTFCRYKGDYERFNELTFRCEECPFLQYDKDANANRCLVKRFKNKYEPDYKYFGSMGYIRKEDAE